MSDRVKSMADHYAKASIAVVWDTVDCKIPVGQSIDSVTDNISSALRNSGYLGNISIKAYGDKEFRVSSQRPNVKLIVAEGTSSQRKTRIFYDILAWALDNPASVLMFVYGDVSRDMNFINDELGSLRFRHFEVLLCQPEDAKGLLFFHAAKVWRWDNLCVGGTPISEPQRHALILAKTPSDYYHNVPDDWNCGMPSDEVEEEKLSS
ncbi:hypothetical protein AALP_AA7G040300 [Arabis alpina]|uniref:NYN domain-containing protein n=1 Tax=Arabis alpina TaxID=50452 RepID=A0A087GFT6_ARAAL|nr:hypothetical protein AALP_AA7G040300 [Arabis alpina]